MASGASDDDILKRYLLGTLAPESQKSVEERLFSDNRIFWEHLCLVEDDLVNDYARGRLDDHEKTDFERNFLCTDDRRGKLELAQALQAFVERQPANRQSAWEWLRGPAVAPRRAVAAAAVLLPLMAAGLVWRLTSLGSGITTRQQTAQTRPELELATAANARLEQELAATKALLAQQLAYAKPVPGAILPAVTPAPGGIFSFSLSPGLLRGTGGELARLRIPPGTQLVRLQLDPAGEEYSSYRVTLHAPTGVQGISLENATRESGGAVVLTLPSTSLPDGDYFVRLSGVRRGADPVVLHRYDFRVLRQ